jgi:AraC family transcriptional regulator, regulatory protein of adaptative response / DNA-3-methyladenine glycosylase II
MLSFLRARAIPGVEALTPCRYSCTIAVGDQDGVLVVEPAEKNCLQATVRFPDLKNLPAIIARVASVVSSTLPPTP